jgi:hypothetical protein
MKKMQVTSVAELVSMAEAAQAPGSPWAGNEPVLQGAYSCTKRGWRFTQAKARLINSEEEESPSLVLMCSR